MPNGESGVAKRLEGVMDWKDPDIDKPVEVDEKKKEEGSTGKKAQGSAGKKPQTIKQKKGQTPDAKSIPAVTWGKFNVTQLNIRVTHETAKKIEEISEKIREEMGGKPFGQNRVVDELVATFADDYLKLKLQSL